MAVTRVVAFVHRNGEKEVFRDRPITQWAGRLLEAAADDTLDILVLGQVDEEADPVKVLWERHYGAMDVLPARFAERNPAESAGGQT